MAVRALIDALGNDVRRAVRRMVRAPCVSVAIVLSLAVGMASVVTLLGVVDSLFFRVPAGVREPARVVGVGPWAAASRLSYPDYTDLRDQTRTLQSVSAFAIWNYTARVGRGVSPARGLLASHSLLSTLGIAPRTGRAISADEDRPGADPVVIVSAPFRARYFNDDAAAVGEIVRLGGVDFTIVGVLPASFTAPDLSPVDLVVPIENAPWFGGREALVNRDYRWVRIVGRLRAGVTERAASAEASAVYRRANVGVRAVDQETLAHEVVPVTSLAGARRDPSSPSGRIAIWLVGLAVIVLCIACANVTSLLVARGIADAREVAIHAALGAGRARLVARSVTEAGTIVLAAALVALVGTRVASRAVTTLLLGNSVAPAPLDGRTGIVVTLVAAVTCAACAVLPVVRLAQTSPHEALARHSRTATGSHRGALRVLVGSQIALGVVLVSEAAVFVASLRNALRADLGIDVPHLVAADVDLRAAGLTEATANAAAARALDAVRRLPGVTAAGMTNAASLPGYLNPPLRVPGRDSAPPDLDEWEPSVSSVTPGFLEALGVRLRRGRAITDDDVLARRPVALVSARFARVYWPGMDALGQCVQVGSRSTNVPCAQVIGIVTDRRGSLDAPHGTAEIYLPAASRSMPNDLATTFLGREIAVRTSRPDIGTELQRTLLDAIPALTSVRVRVADEYLEVQTRSWRLGAVVIGVFAGVALVLAAVGVFSAWTHAVAARRRELGIRGALGALPRDLAWLVIREAALVVAVGVAIGTAGAVAAASTVRAMTFGVSAMDPRVFAATALVFAVVTGVGALTPALRAAFTDPRTVLAAD
ncbi:MAG TPA: ABC transporter permease [Gemmatimonadaceae bacterium]|nr:ABC transporter permease [Gemmatimonadaceae bacterium]